MHGLRLPEGRLDHWMFKHGATYCMVIVIDNLDGLNYATIINELGRTFVT